MRCGERRFAINVAQVTARAYRPWCRAAARNHATYGPFAGIELLLMRRVKAGANRQDMHEVLREVAMPAWAHIEAGQANPLESLLAQDARLLAHLPAHAIRAALDARDYIGDAPERALALAQQIRSFVPTTTQKPGF